MNHLGRGKIRGKEGVRGGKGRGGKEKKTKRNETKRKERKGKERKGKERKGKERRNKTKKKPRSSCGTGSKRKEKFCFVIISCYTGIMEGINQRRAGRRRRRGRRGIKGSIHYRISFLIVEGLEELLESLRGSCSQQVIKIG